MDKNKSIKKSKYDDNTIVYWGGITIYFFMIFFRDVLGYNIPHIALLIYSSILFCIFNVKQCIAFSIAFSILGTGIQIVYAILIGTIIIIFKYRGKLRVSKLFLIFIFLMFWEFAHLFIQPVSIAEYIRYFVMYGYVSMIIYNKNIKINNKLVIYTFIYTTFFVCIDVLLQSLRLTGYSISEFIDLGMRLGYAQQVIGSSNILMLSSDPNLLGQNCIISISCLMLLVSKGYNKKLNYLLIITFVGFGLLTLSKTFILSLVLIGVYVIFYNLIKNRKNISKGLFNLISLILIMIIIIILINTLFKDSIDHILTRFTEGDLTTGRVDAFEKYNNYFMENINVFLFGIGLQEISIKTQVIGSPHTAIQEIIVYWGIIGIILVFFMILFLILNSKRKSLNKPDLINYLPISIFMMIIQTTQLFRFKDRILILILLFVTIQLTQREKNDYTYKIHI